MFRFDAVSLLVNEFRMQKEVQRLRDLIASLEVGKKKDNETIASFKQQAEKDHACIEELLMEKDVKERRIAFLEGELEKGLIRNNMLFVGFTYLFSS